MAICSSEPRLWRDFEKIWCKPKARSPVRALWGRDTVVETGARGPHLSKCKREGAPRVLLSQEELPLLGKLVPGAGALGDPR